jgi:hypothetical protein
VRCPTTRSSQTPNQWLIDSRLDIGVTPKKAKDAAALLV